MSRDMTQVGLIYTVEQLSRLSLQWAWDGVFIKKIFSGIYVINNLYSIRAKSQLELDKNPSWHLHEIRWIFKQRAKSICATDKTLQLSIRNVFVCLCCEKAWKPSRDFSLVLGMKSFSLIIFNIECMMMRKCLSSFTFERRRRAEPAHDFCLRA